MKKRILYAVIFAFSLISAAAAGKITLDGGISVNFSGCADGSVRIEARAAKSRAPVKELELDRTAAEDDFVQSDDGNFAWRSYVVQPVENGYALLFDGREIYTSSFNDDGKILRELRTWKDATEFYGFGEASSKVSLRNMLFTIYNESKYGNHAFLFIPFYITNTGMSVYYNAGGKDQIYFQDGSDPQVYRSSYKRIECYVRQDSSARESVADFYEETKAGSMLPRWAFGFIQSKYGYKTQQEVIDIVDEFKKRGLPLTGIVLDLYWFDKMGDIYWNKEAFPNPEEMDKQLEANGVKLITITEPFYTTASQNYKELKSLKLLCKNTDGKIALWRDWWCLGDREGGILNPLGKKAPEFLGKKYAAMIDSGIDGFWTDLGEPEKAPANLKYNKYTEQDFHNYYNYYWSKAIYDGVKQHHPDRRLFMMSRSGYTGIGRFNVSVWSGDVSVSWSALASQIAYGINAGLCGLPYWGSDVGGFVQENTRPELFVRWHQFGAFTPVYRAHGTGPREPWIFTEKETGIIGKYLNYRMALMPYIYSTARQTMKGSPMMRPMFFEDTATPQQYMGTQYMFGDALLVAPVTGEMSSTPEKSLWLPAGNWYDFETYAKVQGGREINVKTKLETIPLYIKEGAIIPAEKDGKQYLFMIPAPGVKNTFTLYNDDGETEQYKNGAFAETVFTLDGMTLTSSVIGNAEFAPSEIILAVPASVQVGSDWNRDGLYKTKKISLDKAGSEYKL